VRRRITIKPGPGARVNGLPLSDKFWRGNSVIVSGNFEFEVEDLDPYVQVRFQGSSALYTYLDPSGRLRPGDIVQVPTRYAEGNIATVEKLGRGNWSGSALKVTARLVKEELV
jgi:hypothetical protein